MLGLLLSKLIIRKSFCHEAILLRTTRGEIKMKMRATGTWATRKALAIIRMTKDKEDDDRYNEHKTR